MPRDDAVRRLATLWFAGAGVLFLLLFGQTLLGRYADRAPEAWDWFVAVLVPILTLIAGAFFTTRRGAKTGHGRVERRVYVVTYGLSLVYLLAVNAAVLFSPLSAMGPLELMALSELGLEICQGFVTTALGVFFVVEPTPVAEAPAVVPGAGGPGG